MSNIVQLLNDLSMGRGHEIVEEMKKSNLPMFLHEMAKCLIEPSLPAPLRRFASILFKNAISDTRNPLVNETLAATWRHIPEEGRTQLKQMILQVFGAQEHDVRAGAANLIATIGVIELPVGQWDGLIPMLLNNVKTGDNYTKLSTLECLGIICEEINPQHLEAQSDTILNTIVSSFSASNPPIEICRKAMEALLNSLGFAKKNFDNKQQREYIMNFIFQASSSNDAQIRYLAMQCLVRVGEKYYEYLSHFMAAIFEVTQRAMGSDPVEYIAAQAFEFWCTVCEEEKFREEQNSFQANLPLFNFIAGVQGQSAGAFAHLLPHVFTSLCKQPSDDPENDDTTNVTIVATALLQCMSRTVRDGLVLNVMQFAKVAINDQDWRKRDAAVMCIGCVQDGPSLNSIAPHLLELIPALVNTMRSDPTPRVQDSAAWALGEVCLYHPQLAGRFAELLIENFAASCTNANSHIASISCHSMGNLFDSLTELYEMTDGQESEPCNLMTRFFGDIVNLLGNVAARDDAMDNNLRIQSERALISLIRNLPDEQEEAIYKLLTHYAEKLTTTLQSSGEENLSLQTSHCRIILNTLLRLEGKEVSRIGNQLVALFLAVLSHNRGNLIEEAIDCISHVVSKYPEAIGNHFNDLKNLTITGMRSYNQHLVLEAAMFLFENMAEALQEKIYTCDDGQFCNAVIVTLLDDLTHPLEDSAKPAIVSCFGGMASAIGGYFERFIGKNMVFDTLNNACYFSVDADDEDQLQVLINLRENLINSYSSIINALGDSGKANLLEPHVSHIVSFMGHLSQDLTTRTSDLMAAIAGCIGDLVRIFGKPLLEVHGVLLDNIITLCTRYGKKCEEFASYARKQIEKAQRGK